jgi:ribosomal protein S16
MADTIEAGGPEAEPPMGKGLDLSIFLKHVAEVDTPIGKLYLFPLRVSDLRTYSKLNAADTIERIRTFLPCIASLSADYALNQERISITVDQALQLTDQTLQEIAKTYALSNALQSAREGKKDRKPIVRGTDEPATGFLDRLLHKTAEEQANQLENIKKQILGSTHGIFDQVRKSSQTLGETWTQFEKLNQASTIPKGIARPVENSAFENFKLISEQQKKLGRERAEDRELIRLTGQMSSQSAKTLQQLADAASTMLERLDQRDNEAKQTTKVQLWTAVWTVIISAVLGLIALLFSVAAFYQDKANNSSGDEWQHRVLDELKESNKHSAKLKSEIQALDQKVEYLNSALNAQGQKPAQSKSALPNQVPKN